MQESVLPMMDEVASVPGIPLIAGSPSIASDQSGSYRSLLRRGRGAQTRLPPPDSLPLEEAAKLELQSMPFKTPVSVLQELLSRRGSTPKYELVQVEGAIHEPTFRYRVTVGEILAMGTGRSKKEAKHAAAKAILDKLTGNSEGNGLSGSNNNLNEMVKSINSQDERSMVANPIGVLQELCMSRRWPPPAYETEFEEGLPHERLFTISCVVFRHKETGTGKSKKIAKRLAAHNMWQRLKNLPMGNSPGHWNEGTEEDEGLNRNFTGGMKNTSEWDELRHAKISTVNRDQSQTIAQFHKNLKASEGPKLNELKANALKDTELNYVQFLHEISLEHSFDVTYVHIEEKSFSGAPGDISYCDSHFNLHKKIKKVSRRKRKQLTGLITYPSGMFQCIVQLSTLPVAVVHGSGATAVDARTSAALNALHYLKLMTNKDWSERNINYRTLSLMGMWRPPALPVVGNSSPSAMNQALLGLMVSLKKCNSKSYRDLLLSSNLLVERAIAAKRTLTSASVQKAIRYQYEPILHRAISIKPHSRRLRRE